MGEREPSEEETRLQLIIDNKLEAITGLPDEQSTAAYLDALATKMGANKAALWAIYKKTRWPRVTLSSLQSGQATPQAHR